MIALIVVDVDKLLATLALAAIACAVLLPEALKFRRALKLYPGPSLLQRVLGQFGLDAKKQALAELLPWIRPIRPNVLKLREGRYMAAWRFAGSDTGTLTDDEIRDTAYNVSATIGGQSASTKIQFYVRSAPIREYLPGLGWDHPIAHLLDALLEAKFLKKERPYQTERMMVWTWTPPEEWVAKMAQAVTVGVDAQLSTENELLLEFEGMCEAFEGALASRTITLSRLGTRMVRDALGIERRVSDLISLCNMCVSGFNTPLVEPPAGVPIYEYLAVEVRGGYQPRIGELECSAVVPTTFSPEAEPLMLEKLARMKVPFLIHFAFTPLAVADATAKLSRGASNMKAAANFSAKRYVDPAYANAHDQMVESIGKATNDETREGMMSVTLVVRHRDRRRVREAERAIQSVLADCHFRGTVRRNGALDTILSTLPGTEIRKKREYQMNALTVAKMVPLHESSLGRKYAESESFKGIHVPPISYALGPGGHLFREHANAGDCFHSVKFGRRGVGKSVDEAYETALWLTRLPLGYAMTFDRGPSAYQACMMFGGQYYKIFGPSSPGFALFADAHIPAQARVIFNIVSTMVRLSGVEMNGDREEWIKEGIHLEGTRPRSERSMFAFWEHLQDPDDSLRKVLKKYTRLGDMGNTFDCSHDTFDIGGRWNVVDLEIPLSQNCPPEILIPLLEVMFWKSRTSMRRMKEAMGAEGELVHVRYGCDEVNNSLMRHPLGIEFLIDFALMGRKENFGLAMASNSLWKFMQIPGASDLIDAMATLTYFNDPAATGKNRPLYESHELPERAIGWVTELADREYVKFQPEAKVCRRLTRALDKDIMAVIGTSRTVRIVDEYIDRYPVAKYGDGFWQKMMLRAQGADEAADTLEGILAQSEDAKLVVAS